MNPILITDSEYLPDPAGSPLMPGFAERERKTKMKREAIAKAIDDSAFCRESLQEALKTASPIEAIILYDIIGQAATLHRRILELQNATGKES